MGGRSFDGVCSVGMGLRERQQGAQPGIKPTLAPQRDKDWIVRDHENVRHEHGRRRTYEPTLSSKSLAAAPIIQRLWRTPTIQKSKNLPAEQHTKKHATPGNIPGASLDCVRVSRSDLEKSHAHALGLVCVLTLSSDSCLCEEGLAAPSCF